MDEAGEKLKRAFTGAFALLFAVIVLCAVFCNQNVFGTQSPRSLLAGGLALAVGVLCAAWLLRLLPAPGREGHEQVTERVEPLTGLQFPLHELYPSGKQFHEETVLLPFVFPVLDGRRTG